MDKLNKELEVLARYIKAVDNGTLVFKIVVQDGVVVKIYHETSGKIYDR